LLIQTILLLKQFDGYSYNVTIQVIVSTMPITLN